MKKIFFALIPLILLIACKSQTKSALAVKQIDSSALLIKKLKPVYQGVWVKSSYLEKIKGIKSVLAAVALVTGLNGMKIDTSKIKGDSLSVAVGWNNYVPGDLMMKFRKGKNPGAIVFGKDELGYAIQKGDTSLILYQLYKGTVYKTNYYKAKQVNPDETVSDGLNYAINSVLIAGDYLLETTGKPGAKVTFTKNGSVRGLGGFKRYVIEDDLMREPLQNVDLITFDLFTNQQQAYSFRFKNKVLELYEVKPNANATLLVVGKLKYRLTRIIQPS